MLKTTSGIALALLLAASPSALLAQSAQESPAEEPTHIGQVSTPAEPSTTAPARTIAQATSGPPTAGSPIEQDTAQTAVPPEGEGAAMGTPAKPIDGQIVLQEASSTLANDLLGAAVYSPEGETIGKINDLIIGQDGAVEGVVLGVGGFLGIGEKAIAVQMAKLTVTLTPDGEEGLLLNATKADLEAAPAFKTIEQQRADSDAAEAEDAMRLKDQEGVMDEPTAPSGTAQPQ